MDFINFLNAAILTIFWPELSEGIEFYTKKVWVKLIVDF